MHHSGPLPTIADDIRRGIAAVIALAMIVVGAMLATGLAAALSSGEQTGAGALEAWDQWLLLLSFQAAMIALTFAFGRFFGRPRQTLALAIPRNTLRNSLLPFVATVGVMLAYSLISWTFFRDAVLRDIAIFQRLLNDVPLWLPALVLVIGAPVSEELAFRGLLLGQLRRTRLGFAIAAVAATAGWTMLHLSYTLVGLIDVFIAGLMFSWSLWRTGTLWVPIVFHAIYNAIVLGLISATLVQAA